MLMKIVATGSEACGKTQLINRFAVRIARPCQEKLEIFHAYILLPCAFYPWWFAKSVDTTQRRKMNSMIRMSARSEWTFA